MIFFNKKTVRSLVYSSFRLPPLRRFGSLYYESMITRMASTLAREHGVVSVHLVGDGANFLLTIDSDEAWGPRILKLRERVKKIRSEFPLMGRVDLMPNRPLLTDNRLSPAFHLKLARRKTWNGKEWYDSSVNYTGTVHPRSRFALSLHHYFEAKERIDRLSPRRTPIPTEFFDEVQIARTVAGDVSDIEGKDPAWLLASTLSFQEKLLQEPVPKSDGGFRIDFGNDAGERFSNDLIVRHWNRWLRKSDFSEYPVEIGIIPGTLCWKGKPHEVESFLTTYLKVFGGESEGNRYPAVVTSAIHDACLQGNNWQRIQFLPDWIPLPCREDSAWMKTFCDNLGRSYWERAVSDLFFLPGRFMGESRKHLSFALRSLCEVSLSLVTSTATKNLRFLKEEGGKTLPETARTLGRVDFPIDLPEMLVLAEAVQKELSDYLGSP